MPSPAAFAASFGIAVGASVAGFDLIDYSIDERTVSQYRVYEFPLTFTFRRRRGSSTVLLSALNAIGRYHHIVNSEYGNPYDCWYERVTLERDDGTTVVVTALGVGERV